MKKLLLFGLTLAFVGGNVLAVVPQQSLFSDEFIHKPEVLNANKLAVVDSGKKFDFCQAMIDLYNKDTGELSIYKINDTMIDWHIPANPITLSAFALKSRIAMLHSKIKKNVIGIDDPSHVTESAVKQLVNSHFNVSDDATHSFDNVLVIEILKERKNQLVQEMRDAFMEQIHTPSMGDIATEDYALRAICGLAMYFYKLPFLSTPKTEHLQGFQQGIGLSVAVVNLFWLSNYRAALRRAEKEMRKIDAMIKKIEAF